MKNWQHAQSHAVYLVRKFLHSRRETFLVWSIIIDKFRKWASILGQMMRTSDDIAWFITLFLRIAIIDVDVIISNLLYQKRC